MTAARDSGDELLRKLVAGQAQTGARFDEVFRRLGMAEGVAGEARDLAKEIVTILREQDALARVAEAKADSTAQIAALRQDVVHANTGFRTELVEAKRDTDHKLDAFDGRLQDLEDLRTGAAGAAKGARWLLDALKFLLGGGVGAFIFKLLEHL